MLYFTAKIRGSGYTNLFKDTGTYFVKEAGSEIDFPISNLYDINYIRNDNIIVVREDDLQASLEDDTWYSEERERLWDALGKPNPVKE